MYGQIKAECDRCHHIRWCEWYEELVSGSEWCFCDECAEFHKVIELPPENDSEEEN